jgi:hypothetical protein
MDSDFTVMLDGQSVDYIEASNSTTSELFILNTQGNHVVQIMGTSVVPEFPSMTVLILSMVMIPALLAASLDPHK